MSPRLSPSVLFDGPSDPLEASLVCPLPFEAGSGSQEGHILVVCRERWEDVRMTRAQWLRKDEVKDFMDRTKKRIEVGICSWV